MRDGERHWTGARGHIDGDAPVSAPAHRANRLVGEQLTRDAWYEDSSTHAQVETAEEEVSRDLGDRLASDAARDHGGEPAALCRSESRPPRLRRQRLAQRLRHQLLGVIARERRLPVVNRP